MMTTRTFSNFLRSASVEEIGYHIPPNMLSRLYTANIKSRDGYLKWMRERYPFEYKSYSIFDGKNGRQHAEEIWANFLRWSERS
jgi:hypothetical protein